ncbi:MAG: hypothetical protein N3A57_06610 [Negativicutes bacterium]|nr:hypothetical protein [Negativicutes bacterium]
MASPTGLTARRVVAGMVPAAPGLPAGRLGGYWPIPGRESGYTRLTA